MIFALVALPLSMRPHRSGPSMGFGLSILVLVAYYLIAIPGAARIGRRRPPARARRLAPGRARRGRRRDPAGAGRQVSVTGRRLAARAASGAPAARVSCCSSPRRSSRSGSAPAACGTWTSPGTRRPAGRSLATGDPITMHLDGRPWFGPPPLWLWLQAATGWAFGFTEFTARIWAALFGVAGVGVTCLLGWEWFGPRTGILSGLILATTLEYLLMSHLAVLDSRRGDLPPARPVRVLPGVPGSEPRRLPSPASPSPRWPR